MAGYSVRVYSFTPCTRVRSPAAVSRLGREVRRQCTRATQQGEAPQAASGGAGSEATDKKSAKYNWTFNAKEAAPRDDGRQVMDLPVSAIRRPLGRTRGNDPDKVAALMESIKEIGLQEPIDVLEVDGVYYGFSGCHRYEAHQRLGAETIRCRVRKATKEVLKMHIM